MNRNKKFFLNIILILFSIDAFGSQGQEFSQNSYFFLTVNIFIALGSMLGAIISYHYSNKIIQKYDDFIRISNETLKEFKYQSQRQEKELKLKFAENYVSILSRERNQEKAIEKFKTFAEEIKDKRFSRKEVKELILNPLRCTFSATPMDQEECDAILTVALYGKDKEIIPDRYLSDLHSDWPLDDNSE